MVHSLAYVPTSLAFARSDVVYTSDYMDLTRSDIPTESVVPRSEFPAFGSVTIKCTYPASSDFWYILA